MEDFYLDSLGQQPGMQIYTQICLCYAVSNPSTYPAIIETLTQGLERLTENFPWLAGQVVAEGAGEGCSGVMKIVPLNKIPRLIVKDARNDASAPTMAKLREAEFPFRMLDESFIAPRKTLATLEKAPNSPVFQLQATFIEGGVILCFIGEHRAMDGTGQGKIINYLSQLCHSKPLSAEEITVGNTPRRRIPPLLDNIADGDVSKLASEIGTPTPYDLPTQGTDNPSPLTWTYFTFPASSLAALKAAVTESLPASSPFISTDDALTALIWQSVTRVRLSRFDGSTQTRFTRATDVRRHLNVSPLYLGMLSNMTYHSSTFQDLVKEPLGSIAAKLRAALDPKTSDIAHRTRALVTLLEHTKDKSTIAFTGTMNLAVDVQLSSWAKMDCYDLDFNLGLGNPEAVRRPQFTLIESLMYILPRRPDGELTVALCLREDDIDQLNADEGFTRYGRQIV